MGLKPLRGLGPGRHFLKEEINGGHEPCQRSERWIDVPTFVSIRVNQACGSVQQTGHRSSSARFMKPRILLAEDDRAQRKKWAAALEHERFDVSMAEGVRETLYRFCIQTPDVTIFSLNLPAAERIRVLSLMNHFKVGCPIIAITPATERHFQVPPPAHLEGQLKKPLEPARLVEAVKTLLASSRPELLQTDNHSEKESRRSSRVGGRHYRKKTPPPPHKPAGQ